MIVQCIPKLRVICIRSTVARISNYFAKSLNRAEVSECNKFCSKPCPLSVYGLLFTEIPLNTCEIFNRPFCLWKRMWSLIALKSSSRKIPQFWKIRKSQNLFRGNLYWNSYCRKLRLFFKNVAKEWEILGHSSTWYTL